jgi:hypothetical protein
MNNLPQKLLGLFRISDGLLLRDELTFEEISKKQRDIESFNEDIVLHGFITMRDFLTKDPKLANQKYIQIYHLYSS